MSLRFSWDPAKAAANLRKHGVSFIEASTAFSLTPSRSPFPIRITLWVRSVSCLLAVPVGADS